MTSSFCPLLTVILGVVLVSDREHDRRMDGTHLPHLPNPNPLAIYPVTFVTNAFKPAVVVISNCSLPSTRTSLRLVLKPNMPRASKSKPVPLLFSRSVPVSRRRRSRCRRPLTTRKLATDGFHHSGDFSCLRTTRPRTHQTSLTASARDDRQPHAQPDSLHAPSTSIHLPLSYLYIFVFYLDSPGSPSSHRSSSSPPAK